MKNDTKPMKDICVSGSLKRGVWIAGLAGALVLWGTARGVCIDPPEPDEDAEPAKSGAPSAKADGKGDGKAEAKAPAPPPVPTKEEIAELKAMFEAVPAEEQAEMKAYYNDLGINLDTLLGISSAKSAEAARTQELLGAIKDLDFSRTPAAVLAARAKLGFGQVAHPNPNTAKGMDVAKWLQLQVTAGEWGVFGEFLKGRPVAESQGVFSSVLRSLNKGNSGMLPEEILSFADTAPEELKPWQMTALSAMLKAAAASYSTGSMLAQIKTGTAMFGNKDAATARRTVEFLASAGMVVEAYAYLPSLDEARAKEDDKLILVHGLYKEDLATKAGPGTEADAYRRGAWDLFCEVSMLPKATFENRREALTHAIEIMKTMPRAQVTPWLEKVFASETLGPAALEIMALSAVSIGDNKLDVEQRAHSILSLKEAVDVLLARKNVDSLALRVPMRMMTTALVTEIENTVKEKGQQRVIAREAQLLLRAVPNQAWFDSLEPSLASRAGKASIAIATVADETDMALSLLSDAIKRSPSEAVEFAEHFLKFWEGRLSPKNEFDDEYRSMYYFYREYLSSAPLTRGRQRRNLQRLHHLMETLEAIGIEPRRLPSIASAFKACHSKTEVYDREDIIAVFGAIDKIPVTTLSALAESMGASLNGDWRNRAAQQAAGTKRTDSEIAILVDRGYGLALDLIDQALVAQPDSWKNAAIKAGLSYDRVQFKQAQQKQEPGKQNEYRQAAFAAFEQAAGQYVKAIANGEEREDADVFIRWFGAAMGTAELNFLRVDDIPTDGSPQDDQIDKIRKAIGALPADVAFRHISDFARAMSEVVGRSDPEVKPRLVHHALRIIGDHPAGASLRSLEELYRDLVKDEIRLRLTIDGEDRVGTGQPFAMLVSLRFTNSVDRETGGFSKYLQNNIYTRVGRQYKEVNYRDVFQKSVETALDKAFKIEAIAFFDAFMPSRGVTEDGQGGWLEKPMAYVLVTRKDPSIDRVPQVSMDMQFDDQTGPVTLALPSNTPPLAVNGERSTRPCLDMTVTQIVDVRDAQDRVKDRSIKLEVQVKGKGVVPDIKDVLAGIDGAIEGYTIAENGIEAKPPIILQEGEITQRFYWGPPQPPKGGYPEPDEKGMYRLDVERTWTITYLPTSGSLGTSFRVPTLKDGIKAKLESRFYTDMDVVPVVGSSVDVRSRLITPVRMAIGGTAIVGAGALVLLGLRMKRRRVVPRGVVIDVPEHVTPLSAVMTLRRFQLNHSRGLDEARRDALAKDIAEIELKYFGPGPGVEANGELSGVVNRWATAVRGEGNS